MILMGAGTNHWFHSDTIYRGFLALTTLTGCQGGNGGGWAHYVGQEKCRPITGWAQLAFGLDWQRPPRQMIHTAYWYLHTDQFRYDPFGADTVAAKTGRGLLAGMSTADVIAKSARMGWMPSYPTFDRNPLDLADEAAAAGRPVAEYVVEQLKNGGLRFAGEDPDAPENLPRILAIWRANLLGSSGKGNEYFLKHLLGTDSSLRAARRRRASGPRRSSGTRTPPRASSTCCSPWTSGRPARRSSPTSCCPRPPGTRSTTSTPPTCIRSSTRSTRRSRRRGRPAPTGTPGRPSPPSSASSAAEHLGTRRDVVAVPLLHDTPDEMANPHGVVRDWKHGECEPGARRHDAEAGRGRAGLHRGRRPDAGARAADGQARRDHQGDHLRRHREVEYLRHKNGPVHGGAGRRPAVAGARRPGLRGDPGAVRDHQRRTSPPRASGPWRSAPAPCCTTWRPSTRASRSPSPTPRPHRCR